MVNKCFNTSTLEDVMTLQDKIQKVGSMMTKVPLTELEQRLRRFREAMDDREPDWGMALIISKINQFYHRD